MDSTEKLRAALLKGQGVLADGNSSVDEMMKAVFVIRAALADAKGNPPEELMQEAEFVAASLNRWVALERSLKRYD